MKRLGIIRLDQFKRVSIALKKALGILHGHALEKLSRSCGTSSYNELRALVIGRQQSEDGLAPGTDEELLAAWRSQLSDAFNVSVDEVLGADFVDLWFKRVFAPRARLDECPSEGDTSAPNSVVDPVLEASNWQDTEFRAWVQGLIVRPTQPARIDVKHRRKWKAPVVALTEVEA